MTAALTAIGMLGISAYISSGFFCPDTVNQIENVKQILSEEGYGYFSPKDSVFISPNALKDGTGEEAKRERREAFAKDVGGVSAATDFAIVNLSRADGGTYDPGTLFEAGVAWTAKKPIVYFQPDEAAIEAAKNGTKKLNLMMAESSIRVLYGYAELRAFLKELKAGGDFTYEGFQKLKQPFEGEVE